MSRLVTCIQSSQKPCRFLILVSSFTGRTAGAERPCVFSKFQRWGGQAGACGRPWFQQWCHLPLAASSYTTSLIKRGKNQI